MIRIKKYSLLFIATLLSFSHLSCNDSDEIQQTPEIDQRIKRIMSSVNMWVLTEEIAGGVVLIIRDGNIVLHEAVGLADIEEEIPMKKNHIFRIRSNTKPFVGTAILMLKEEGKISLDDAVASYIPSFDTPDKRNVTIYQLLNHTSGLDGPSIWGKGFNTLWEAVEFIGNEYDFKFTPGTDYSYSNAGSSTLGAVIQAITGDPPEVYIKERIIEPLVLDDTFCTLIPESDPRHERILPTYSKNNSSFSRVWDNTQPKPVPFFRCAGGMFSTAIDYAKFLTMMLNEGNFNGIELLSPETVRMATRSQLDHIGMNRYGLHWMIMENVYTLSDITPGSFGHNGSDGTIAFVDPENKLVVVYFTQTRGTGTRSLFIRYLYDAIYQ